MAISADKESLTFWAFLTPSEELSASVALSLDSDGESVSSVTCSETWITATTDGEVTVDENTSVTEEDDGSYTSNETAARTGTVTWTTSDGNTAVVSVTQLGNAFFTAVSSELSFGSASQSVVVATPTTTATTEEVSIVSASCDASWVSYESGVLSIEESDTVEEREATLYLYLEAGDFCGSTIITITQEGAEGSLSVLSTIRVSASGGTFDIQVVSTGGEDVESWTDDIGWISLNKATTTGNSGNINFYATVEDNTYGVARTATITFVGSYGDTATCIIEQYAGTLYITLSSDTVTLSQGGSTKTVTISASGSGVSLPLSAETDADWLTVTSTDSLIRLYAVANTGEVRSTTVTLSSEEGATATLTVAQLAAVTRESSRLIPMQCGDDESYVLHFYDGEGDYLVLDIYDASTRKLYQSIGGGDPPLVPFPSGSARELTYVQSFDVIFFAQGQTKPCKLIREESDDSDGNEYVFSFENIDFVVEPLMDWNIDSECVFNVFAQGDEDLLLSASEEEEDSVYYHKGDVRQSTYETTGTAKYSHFSEDTEKSGENATSYIKVYGKVTLGDSTAISQIVVGKRIDLDSTLTITDEVVCKALKTLTVQTYDNADVEYTTADRESGSGVVVSFSVSSGRVTSIGTTTVTILIALLDFSLTRTSSRKKRTTGNGWTTTYGTISHSLSSSSSASCTVKYGDPVLFVCKSDSTATSISVTDTDYYEVFRGSGSGLALTIDGSNTNESVSVGQYIALKYKNTAYLTELWDYDTYPSGTDSTQNTSLPLVSTLDVLDSKVDANDLELRPGSGGGYGFSSDWVPIRGEVTLKTEGTWSGVIELQQIDAEGVVSVIGRITSENGLSNTEITREITEFGCAVRVACTRREHAYQTEASIYGSGFTLKYIVVDCDTGCQWTLTSTDIQTSYFRITALKTLSSGENVFICDVLSGVSQEFYTTSYALGAWSTQNGYPEQITIFQERMVYGCNKQKPTTLWLSKTNDWEDFEAGSDDTSAMNYTMQTDKYDRIRWLLALKSGITLGTDYGEWQFGEANGGVVTIDNARYINTSSIGSATNIPAVVLGQALIMCKTGAEQLHRIDYNTLSEESAGTQLSLLSSHLFEDDPVYDMMVLRSPTNTMYCLHESGKLTSFTYEPEYDVAGWAQHSILDGVLAACVVRRSGVDIIAMIVKNGDEYVLGELNPQSEVYQDDGEDYTSTLIPTPLVSSQGGSAYGVKSVFAGVDVYATEGTQFEVCLPGGSWHHVEVGYDTSNTIVPFDKPKVTVPAAAGWEDEPLIAIRSSYAAPLTIAAIGAAIRRGK